MGLMEKVRDTEEELRYVYDHTGGWWIALLAAAAGAAGVALLGGAVGWVVAGVGALLAAAGLGRACYRLELTLDLSAGRFTYRRGFLWSMEAGEGTFDEIERVVLEKEIEPDGEVEDWEVELEVGGWPGPVKLAESDDEPAARREAERLASKLGVDVVELTDTS